MLGRLWQLPLQIMTKSEKVLVKEILEATRIHHDAVCKPRDNVPLDDLRLGLEISVQKLEALMESKGLQ